MSRKFFLRFIVAVFFSLAPCSYAVASSLPDVEGWLCGALRVTGLDTLSGNYGLWQERLYRTEDGVSVKAVWMEGQGPAMFTTLSPGVLETDGLLGVGSEYEVFEIDSRVAVLEKHPVLGFVLVLRLEGGILTLESDSSGLTRERLSDTAAWIVSKMI